MSYSPIPQITKGATKMRGATTIGVATTIGGATTIGVATTIGGATTIGAHPLAASHHSSRRSTGRPDGRKHFGSSLSVEKT